LTPSSAATEPLLVAGVLRKPEKPGAKERPPAVDPSVHAEICDPPSRTCVGPRGPPGVALCPTGIAATAGVPGGSHGLHGRRRRRLLSARPHSGKEVVVNPYTYKVGGKDVLMTSLVVPIKSANDTVIGVAGMDMDL
jgi:hypothetical protein